jgi:hypothetical protein
MPLQGDAVETACDEGDDEDVDDNPGDVTDLEDNPGHVTDLEDQLEGIRDAGAGLAVEMENVGLSEEERRSMQLQFQAPLGEGGMFRFWFGIPHSIIYPV